MSSFGTKSESEKTNPDNFERSGEKSPSQTQQISPLTSPQPQTQAQPHPTVREFRLLVLGGILTVLAVVACIFVILLGMSLSDFGQGVLVGILAPALAAVAI